MGDKITINLSQSAMSHLGCERDFLLTVVDGYKEPALSQNIIYGEAVHKFIDVMYKCDGAEWAIPIAMEKAKEVFNRPKLSNRKSEHLSDERHMSQMCINLWMNHIKNERDFSVLRINNKCPFCEDVKLSNEICFCCSGKKIKEFNASELTFSIKYYEDEWIVVNLCGTIDRLGKLSNGLPVIRDWKTTSSWNANEYLEDYKLSRQLRFYTLAIKLMGIMHPESVIGKIGLGTFGCVIDGVFIKPAVLDSTVKSSEVFIFSDDDINKFRDDLDLSIHTISGWIKDGMKKRRGGIINGSCNRKFGKCYFWNVCSVNNDKIGDVLLKRDFIQKPYNPLNYNE